MNDDENFIHKYYSPFLLSNNHEDVYFGPEYDSEKRILCHNKNMVLDLLLNKSKSFEYKVSLIFLFSATKTFHRIWLKLVNTVTSQVTTFTPMIK